MALSVRVQFLAVLCILFDIWICICLKSFCFSQTCVCFITKWRCPYVYNSLHFIILDGSSVCVFLECPDRNYNDKSCSCLYFYNSTFWICLWSWNLSWFYLWRWLSKRLQFLEGLCMIVIIIMIMITVHLPRQPSSWRRSRRGWTWWRRLSTSPQELFTLYFFPIQVWFVFV